MGINLFPKVGLSNYSLEISDYRNFIPRRLLHDASFKSEISPHDILE